MRLKEVIKKIIRPFKKIISSLRKIIFLKVDNFSIISNNCWGGIIYKKYNLPYNTPTVGMYFMADDYIKFLKNLKYYINRDIQFISIEKSRYREKLLKENYNGLIGVLDDVEIMFLHYKDINDATEKWNRRCQRINWENLIIKFNDQNGCKYHHIQEFDKLEYKNKICFTSKIYTEIECNVFMSEYKNLDYVSNDVKKYNKYLNITKYLNNLK